jgi:hypothetical protein
MQVRHQGREVMKITLVGLFLVMVAASSMVHRWDGSLDSVAPLWHQAEPSQPIAPVLSLVKVKKGDPECRVAFLGFAFSHM